MQGPPEDAHAPRRWAVRQRPQDGLGRGSTPTMQGKGPVGVQEHCTPCEPACRPVLQAELTLVSAQASTLRASFAQRAGPRAWWAGRGPWGTPRAQAAHVRAPHGCFHRRFSLGRRLFPPVPQVNRDVMSTLAPCPEVSAPAPLTRPWVGSLPPPAPCPGPWPHVSAHLHPGHEPQEVTYKGQCQRDSLSLLHMSAWCSRPSLPLGSPWRPLSPCPRVPVITSPRPCF